MAGIVLFGASGRMGQEVIASCGRKKQTVIGGIVGADDPMCGTDVEGVENTISSDWVDAYDGADAIIDFSTPAGAKRALEISIEKKIPVLICTTGLDDEIKSLIAEAAKVAPVICASNTSVGVNVLRQLVRNATSLLGDEFETEIVELHHKYKRDSPSGTAVTLAEDIADEKGEKLSEIICSGRVGDELSRAPNELGVQAVRGGDVAGEHTVYFFGNGERIEITHRATTRAIFADGAVRAAMWLVEKKGQAGSYSMIDVLSS